MTQALPSSLIVIPCLNEAAHIGALLDQLRPAAARLGARIIVADGGSTDGTLAIVEDVAARDPRVILLHNKRRIQSAAINLAVGTFGEGADYLIRIDAHGGYPDDYCDRLLEEALATSADSVVVSMLTSGNGTVQKSVAAAQNSKLGTGGSKHRHLSAGEWVDHGHHALMRISAFGAVGGYDETFSHNEDAELDYRLRQAGYKIWMSGKTQMVYYPRASLKGLYFQYLGYGRGRAKNVLKHRVIPKVRQMVPLAVFPVVLLAAFSFVHWIAAVPLLIWAAVCLGYGLVTAIRQRNADIALAGVSAMVMHFGWSVGFWLQLLGLGARRRGGVMAGKNRSIDIGVCTFRRPELADTLRSLAAMEMPAGFDISVIVADNDDTPSAQALVTVLSHELALPIRYRHAPARNISIARNACLDASAADFLAFIDDDETASARWLAELVSTAEETGAAAVLGPVRALYHPDAPDWMRRGDFHSTLPVWVRGEIRTGYTCNVLLRMGSDSLRGRRFSLARGQTGGEDTELFDQMVKAGGRIAFSPDAWVDEVVPGARAAFDWLGRRRFRVGQTHGHLLGQNAGGIGRVKQVGLASAKAAYCFAAALPFVASPVRRNRSVLRGIMHVGVVSGLVGVREIRLYGQPSPGEGGKRAA